MVGLDVLRVKRREEAEEGRLRDVEALRDLLRLGYNLLGEEKTQSAFEGEVKVSYLPSHVVDDRRPVYVKYKGDHRVELKAGPWCDDRYAIGVARRGGQAVGYAVFKKGLFNRVADEGLVCDFVCAPDDDGARAALLRWLASRARAAGAARLVAVFPETQPEWQAFQKAGFHAAGTMYFVVGRSWIKRYRMRWLFETWFTTLGDTDIV